MRIKGNKASTSGPEIAANAVGERRAYISMMMLLYIALIGISFLRYVFYLLPIAALFIWLTYRNRSVNFTAMPFWLLLAASISSLYEADANGMKMSYLMFVYTFTFTLFDFSKIEINFNKSIIFIFFVFLIHIVLGGEVGHISFSLINSESTFESTLAFPLGVLALYFFIVKKYFSFIISVVLCVIMLKRIVIVALFLAIAPRFLGERLRSFILNPYTVSIFCGLTVMFLIELAKGSFDVFFVETIDQSANQFTKGRKELWDATLNVVNFNYSEFAFWGVGQGKVTTLLENAFHTKDIRLHSDLLLLVLQFGGLIFISFIFFLNKHDSMNKRTMSLFLTTLFLTDNVLVYQHVMVFYFLAMSQLERAENKEVQISEN